MLCPPRILDMDSTDGSSWGPNKTKLGGATLQKELLLLVSCYLLGDILYICELENQSKKQSKPANVNISVLEFFFCFVLFCFVF